MADIFNTEDYEDNSEDNIQNQILNHSQIQVEVEEISELPNFQNDNSSSFRESDKENSEVNYKQSDFESDQFAVDALPMSSDDLVEKLEKLATSDVGFNRQLAVCSVLETLRMVQGNEEYVGRVINVLCTLSEDYGPTVRMEVMVKLPSIVQFCKEVGLSTSIQHYLIATILNYLGEHNSLVRKTTHSSLLSLIEQNLIDSATLHEKICPLIVNLTDNSQSEDIRTESILLMSKIAVCLGKKILEELFLDLIFDFCVDTCNNIRKACASCFGDICSTVGRETTEKLLLPKFYDLCKDNAWCVRKACAENFMPVSCVVSREIRCRELSDLYRKLLADQSRWVRLTAYQALGPFISTFAEPEKTGLYCSEDGVLTVVEPPPVQQTTFLNNLNCSQNCANESSLDSDNTWFNPCDKIVPLSHSGDVLYNGVQETFKNVNFSSVAVNTSSTEDNLSESRDQTSFLKCKVNGVPEDQPDTGCYTEVSKCNYSSCVNICSHCKSVHLPASQCSKSETEIQDILEGIECGFSTLHLNSELCNGHETALRVESNEHRLVCLAVNGLDSPEKTEIFSECAFNHFQYWRDPIPELGNDEYHLVLYPVKPNSYDSSFSHQKYEKCFNEAATEQNRDLSESLAKVCKDLFPFAMSVEEQDIVPPDLLHRYLNMTDSVWASDGEIARHCAYSLPAVVFTLGRKFWPCLKRTFEDLSSDIQGFIMMWKVRRTVASSMHQLAVILGPEITSRDLLPVFARFISDLDEVRIGVLQHLADFLKVLRSEERRHLLPRLSEFLVSNNESESNEKNWRFRLLLAEQLALVADLYEPPDVKDHLVPLSFTLIQDKICEVRLAAVKVMAAVVKKMSQHSTSKLTKHLMEELNEKFIRANKWLHRQLFVYICQEIIVEMSLSAEQFAEEALPSLLCLCWDRVPNVRIAVARCLADVIWPLEVFSGSSSPHRELILETIHTLQSDIEEDVRFYANKVSAHDCSCLQPNDIYLGDMPV